MPCISFLQHASVVVLDDRVRDMIDGIAGKGFAKGITPCVASTTTLCAVFFVILLWPENMGFQPCFHCPGGHQSAPPSGVIKPAVSEPRNVVVLGGIEEILARGSPALISPGV